MNYPCKECLVKIPCIDRKELCDNLNQFLEPILEKLLFYICPDCGTRLDLFPHRYECEICKHQFYLRDNSVFRSVKNRMIFQNLIN